MPRFARYVLVLIGAACVVFLAVVAVTAAVYSPTYVYRYLTLMDADVGDHARFPARVVEAAPEPHRFAETADAGVEQAVVSALEGTSAVGGDLDGFLTDTQTQALIVIRDGEVLFERYVGEFKRESIATSFSTAKSFLSALVGIAIEEGVIGGIDDPITEYLPELLERDARFGDIKIRHLLNMSSGIHYVETGLPNGDDALTYYFDDLEKLALERTTIDGPPGEEWLYNNYHPLLLGVILERTTGMLVADYLEAKIWQPIGQLTSTAASGRMAHRSCRPTGWSSRRSWQMVPTEPVTRRASTDPSEWSATGCSGGTSSGRTGAQPSRPSETMASSSSCRRRSGSSSSAMARRTASA